MAISKFILSVNPSVSNAEIDFENSNNLYN